MFSLGLGESLIALIVAIAYIIPIAVVVWIVLTLKKIRADHAWVRGKLESIGQLLRKGSAE